MGHTLAMVIKSSRANPTAEAVSKYLRKFCALYSQYGKDSVLLCALAYNCGPGVVNKSTVLKMLKRADRDIFKSYTSHCRNKGTPHSGLRKRRLTELAPLYIP